MPSIADIRQDYARNALHQADLSDDPVEQFGRWFEEVLEAGAPEPNAMTLATAGADGVPDARIVLLKGFDADGFVFYTNYRSAKAAQIKDNPRATMLFYWPVLGRTVRIGGQVTKVAREKSEAYFASRPRASQIGAWASEQSQALPDRSVLEQRFAELEKAYEDKDVPTPPHWGGYRLRPEWFEFWQGQPSRLHDRFRYVQQTEGAWRRERVAP